MRSFTVGTGQVQGLPVPGLSDAVLAPDGSALLYALPDLLLVSLDGAQRVIDRGPGGGLYPDWSADGKKVLVAGSEGLKSLHLGTGDIEWLLKGNVQDAVWPLAHLLAMDCRTTPLLVWLAGPLEHVLRAHTALDEGVWEGGG
jgi:hypothetical protein